MSFQDHRSNSWGSKTRVLFKQHLICTHLEELIQRNINEPKTNIKSEIEQYVSHAFVAKYS